jgi:hypothetical protein
MEFFKEPNLFTLIFMKKIVTTQHKNKNNAEKYLFLGNDTTRDTRINKNITT